MSGLLTPMAIHDALCSAEITMTQVDSGARVYTYQGDIKLVEHPEAFRAYGKHGKRTRG